MTPRKPGRPRKPGAWVMLAVRCPPELVNRLVARTHELQETRPGITMADVTREMIAAGLDAAEVKP